MPVVETDETGVATVAATRNKAGGRIEIVAQRRRAHTASSQVMVATESLRPGEHLQDLVRRHKICPSLDYRWQRLGDAVVVVRARMPMSRSSPA